MKFSDTKIAGVVLIETERKEDERGYFARTWDAEVAATHGLFPAIAPCSTSFNAKAGTLRGMHYQDAPHAEAKTVRCTRGAIYDVALDLRLDSPTFKQWVAYELTAENGRMLYIPEGCAHGFQTLADATEVSYQMNVPYREGSARAVRFDDPAFGISWPETFERIISPKDRALPDWELRNP